MGTRSPKHRPNSPILRGFPLAAGVALLALQVPALLSAPAGDEQRTFFIRDYLVEGVTQLQQEDIESAVYPFLGPDRSLEDIEQARLAIEAAYRKKGFQTVSVSVPSQLRKSYVRIQVTEVPVGRLRVRGATYSAPSSIKELAPSLAEGKVIDFNKVSGDMAALNRMPDRQVTPSIKAGAAPGTVDVDLTVKEKSPVHASVELNNRRSAGTTPLRLVVAASDSNIAQSGHALGFSFQGSPQDTKEVRVFSAYYVARFPSLEGVSFQLQGTSQNSNVSTLGDLAVAGKGKTLGVSADFNLPSSERFFQSVSVGLDYKHYNNIKTASASSSDSSGSSEDPITYYPLSASYSAGFQGKQSLTTLSAGLTVHARVLGGGYSQFQNSRYGADGNFVSLHLDLSRRQDLKGGFQFFGKLVGQVSDQPLIGNEQLSGGGLGTARGYLEAEALGDNGLFGSLEFRSPSLGTLVKLKDCEWRLFAFWDAGHLSVLKPLPDQIASYSFASYGFGTLLRVGETFEGSVEAGFPRATVGESKTGSVRAVFRAGLSY